MLSDHYMNPYMYILRSFIILKSWVILSIYPSFYSQIQCISKFWFDTALLVKLLHWIKNLENFALRLSLHSDLSDMQCSALVWSSPAFCLWRHTQIWVLWSSWLHVMVVVGMGPCSSSASTSLLKQSHPEAAAQDCFPVLSTFPHSRGAPVP